eukprot:scaffold10567_cov180-Chaetoceros_neogracile.AAC.2
MTSPGNGGYHTFATSVVCPSISDLLASVASIRLQKSKKSHGYFWRFHYVRPIRRISAPAVKSRASAVKSRAPGVKSRAPAVKSRAPAVINSAFTADFTVALKN